MQIWDLKPGWTFKINDQPDVELLFLGIDGAYAKVKALDPEINEKLCAQYDAKSDFFCMMTWAEVTPITPKVFQVIDTEKGDSNG